MTRFFGLLIGFFALQQAAGQQFSFIHHSIEDGLAQSQVRAINQDYNGFLWFATMGGVSKFDGTEFYNYSTEDGLIDNQVNCILNSANTDIWFGCAGGISRFNGTEFFSYPFDKLSENYLVYDIVELSPGELLLATNGNGLLRFSESSGEFSRVSAFPDDAFIRKLLLTKSGDLLVGSRRGMFMVPGVVFENMTALIENVSVSDISINPGGSIWLSTFGDGIFLLKQNSTVNVTEEQGLQNNFVREITQDSSGHIWVASRSGLNKVSPDGQPIFKTNIGLNYENIKTTFMDREENLWIGTDGKGVYRFTGEQFVTFSKQDGLISDIAMAINSSSNRGMWIGSYDNGACLFKGDTAIPYTMDQGMLHNTIWAIHTDRDGGVWFGTNTGISYLGDDGFTSFYGPTDSTEFDRVTAINSDDKGRIWFGIVNGVAIYDDGRFLQNEEVLNFPGKRVRCIFESANGEMWFGAENGLVKSEGETYRVYNPPGDTRNSVVYNVTEDYHNRIWVGTKSGLFALSGDQLVPVVFSDGFGSNSINFLQPHERYLYIGTNNGLFVLDVDAYNQQQNIRTEHFTDQEGLASLECNQNAVFLDEKGVLWFGTTEGVIRFAGNDKIFGRSNYQPIVLIKDIKLMLEEKDWKGFADSLDVRTGLPIGLELEPKNNHLTFEFVGLYYSNPGKVLYQYKLEGADEDWLPQTSTNFATYASLPHGQYTFRVRAKIEGAEWNETHDAFNFSILPPFYLTWWFILISVLVSLIFATGLVYALLKSEARKRKTQQLVYTSRLLALEQQTLNSSMNRHFIFNALNSIQYYINRQDKLSANKYLSSFARLIRKNLDSSQSNFTSLADEIERIELYLSLENMRFPDKFSYNVTVDPKVDTHAVQIPAMLFQPYLENSIWHGILPMKSHGEISVEVFHRGDDIEIKIVDNGIGIDESRKLRNENTREHIPQGMQINRNRIELFRKMTDQNFNLEGPFDRKAIDPSEQGTVVAITFPLKSSIQKALDA